MTQVQLFASLVISYLKSLLLATLASLTLMLLFSRYLSEFELWWVPILSLLTNIFLIGIFCCTCFLPIGLIERKKPDEGSYQIKFKKYLPVLCLPLLILLIIVLFSDLTKKDYIASLFMVINANCIAYISLLIFLKQLKK